MLLKLMIDHIRDATYHLTSRVMVSTGAFESDTWETNFDVVEVKPDGGDHLHIVEGVSVTTNEDDEDARENHDDPDEKDEKFKGNDDGDNVDFKQLHAQRFLPNNSPTSKIRRCILTFVATITTQLSEILTHRYDYHLFSFFLEKFI